MTTVAVATDEVYSALQGPRREIRDSVSGTWTTGQTAVTLGSGKEVREGDWLGVADELAYVDDQTDHNDFTIVRAERSSTAVQHAAGTKVVVNPMWWRHKIIEALKDEILNLPRDVFASTQVELSIAANTPHVEITGVSANVDIIRILDLRREPDPSTERINYVPHRFIRDTLKQEFTNTGYGIQIHGGIVYKSARSLWCTYAHTFDTSTFVAGTELETTVGLSARLVDAVKYGAIWRLQSTRELARAQARAQAPSRRAEEIPPMYQAQAAVQYDAIRDELVEQEIAWLESKWGSRVQP